MDYLVVAAVSLLAALLTLYSGFGLGTLLLPAFLIAFGSAPLAVAATAVVHLANNLFKLALIGRRADRAVVLRFGVPAVAAAVCGALLLQRASALPALVRYTWVGRTHSIEPVGLLVGLLMVAFALLEWSPRLNRAAFPASALPLGGLLSGFFGGLSGHQGALRAAFLARCGLDKDAFIGSGVACAVLVDITRLAVYGAAAWRAHFALLGEAGGAGLVAAGVISAFAGSWLGAKLLGKTTMAGVQRIVAVMLIALGAALAAGWL